MSIDINVHLRNKGSKTSRAQGLLSAKETYSSKKQVSNFSTKKNTSNMGALATFMSSGNILKSGLMKVPILRTAMALGKTADKGINFFANIYQARSGERMMTSNTRAFSKVATTLGASYLEGAIDNWLYRGPEVERQNYMLDYGRNLYTMNVQNDKNKFS